MQPHLDQRSPLRVFDGVVDQVADGRYEIPAVAGHGQVSGRVVDLESHVRAGRRRTQQLDGLADDDGERHHLLAGRLVGLDPRQVEQIIDDAPEALRFGRHPLRQPIDDQRIVLAVEGLGQQAQAPRPASSAHG